MVTCASTVQIRSLSRYALAVNSGAIVTDASLVSEQLLASVTVTV